MSETFLQIAADIPRPIETVWELLNGPEHICAWNAASQDWHTVRASNDLRVGGQLTSRMEAKDGSFGFDFGGTYTMVETPTALDYTLGDGRRVRVRLTEAAHGHTRIVEEFEPESENPVDMQQAGWQAILDNFARYCQA